MNFIVIIWAVVKTNATEGISSEGEKFDENAHESARRS